MIMIFTLQTLSNTIILFIVKSVAGKATDLTINYANFAPLNVFNLLPYNVRKLYPVLTEM